MDIYVHLVGTMQYADMCLLSRYCMDTHSNYCDSVQTHFPGS